MQIVNENGDKSRCQARRQGDFKRQASLQLGISLSLSGPVAIMYHVDEWSFCNREEHEDVP
jgi:hypothetical protein